MEIQDLSKYFRIIRRWWWVVILLFGATVGTMLVIAFLTEVQYEATVTVQISAPPPQEVPLYSDFGRQAVRDEIVQTRDSFSELLLEGDIPYRALEALPDIRMIGGELRDRITIEFPENSQLVHVLVRASDSETAALLANTLVETGLDRYGQLLAQPTANTRQFIERELEVTREELTAAEAELAQFKIANKLGDLNSAINNHYNLGRSLTMQRDLAWAEGDKAKAQALEEVILKREAELQNMIGLSAEYYELVDRVERVRATYDYLLDTRSEAQIKENQILAMGSIQIITPARPPQKPVSAIDSKLIVLGAVASILAGVLLTFLLEYLEVVGAFRGFKRLPQQSEMVTLAEGAE
jgi:uncharacterized protein involved in exopolysaccharide biosynthesis